MPQEEQQVILDIQQQIDINADADAAFTALLGRLSQLHTPDGQVMPMTLETFPGGRWYRKLDGDNGHLWGHVQVIKRPGLLELTGPMFMSYPAINHIQFRVSTESNHTVLTLRHRAVGMIPEDQQQGASSGWDQLLKGVRQDAEHH